MLRLDTKNPSNTHTTASSTSLLAFKPRQVLLAQHNSKNTMVAPAKEESSSKITSLTPELKGTLHQSILDYFHRNGFSKSLKRFQSEAPIQSDIQKASLVHLEDIFFAFDTCNADGNKNTSKKPVLESDETTKKDNVCTTNEEITTKKKKKKVSTAGEKGAIEDQPEVADTKMFIFGKNCGQMSEDIKVNELETKPKKKKTKHDFNSSCQVEVPKSDFVKKPLNDTVNGLKIEDSTEKVAEKEKKKKKKLSTDSEDTEKEAIEIDNTKKEEKSSKKRKRSSSDENDNLTTEMAITEESKRLKTETFKEKKSKKKGGNCDGINGQETSNKQVDEQTNGQVVMNGGEKSGAQKSAKKQRNVTDEPKTVNAFQRVKIDQVEFAHEKLQDNSYWAKDGAEIGYGAKAQEVLGQVRGRDFRHEKTKKKRGSYRGGLIDLQSHSIKFNDSDEE